MHLEEAKAYLEQHGIDLILAQFVDIHGAAKTKAVPAEHLEMMLIANFHTALDARYALSNGIIYAVFLHPMSTLTHDQLESAIRQVAALARNFGSSYSSDELIFGVESGEKT